MKIGAGILGILWGIFALLTFGIFYGGFHSLLEEIQTGTATNARQDMIEKYIGIGLPLVALMGGTISFGQGLLGGMLMIGAAGGIFWKMDETFMGIVLAGPLALAGLIAIVGEFSGGKSASATH